MYSVLQQKSNKILKVLLVFQLMNLVVEITWLQCNFWPPVSMGFIFSSDSHLPKNVFLLNESPLKLTKNAFYFILKALFVLKIIFVLTFWSCRKIGVTRKIKLISKFMASQPG